MREAQLFHMRALFTLLGVKAKLVEVPDDEVFPCLLCFTLKSIFCMQIRACMHACSLFLTQSCSKNGRPGASWAHMSTHIMGHMHMRT